MFKSTPGSTGDLLLAAYSEPEQKGTILWSWHIWVTDYDPGTGETIGDVPGGKIYDISADGGIWMDRDLGALSAMSGQVTAQGYAYQWGRKDPFPMGNSLSENVLRPLYDAKGNYLQLGVVTKDKTASGQLIVDQSVSEPGIFYTVTSGNVEGGYWWGGNNSTISLWSDNVKNNV